MISGWDSVREWLVSASHSSLSGLFGCFMVPRSPVATGVFFFRDVLFRCLWCSPSIYPIFIVGMKDLPEGLPLDRMNPFVYLDYNATTPLDNGVLEVMLPLLSRAWGNPSSIHQAGRHARVILDDCREKVASRLGCKPSEIIFTSGGTESSNLAICGMARANRTRGRHIITSSIEHHAVLHTCQYIAANEGFDLTILPVSSEGRIDPQSVKDSLRKDTCLVSVMAANNEIGTLQPISAIGDICREAGVPFHTDAVQWFGKLPCSGIGQFNADLVSICAHKLHGPKGAGALYMRSPLQLHPTMLGGAHENERRAGTENLAAIAGLADCLDRFVTEPVFQVATMLQLTSRLRKLLKAIPGVTVITPELDVLPNTVTCVVERAEGIALVAGLDLEGICVSSGAACSAGSLEPSHVIEAIGMPCLANSVLRFSFGRENTLLDLDVLELHLRRVIQRAQAPQ